MAGDHGVCTCPACCPDKWAINAAYPQGNVLTLPVKCPLCDGVGSVNAMDEDGWVRAHTCSMCKGTGRRPTDAELEARRVTDTRG